MAPKPQPSLTTSKPSKPPTRSSSSTAAPTSPTSCMQDAPIQAKQPHMTQASQIHTGEPDQSATQDNIPPISAPDQDVEDDPASTGPAPVTPAAPLDSSHETSPLLMKLLDVRTLATIKGFYLPLGESFVPSITWVREGRGNIAVSREAADVAIKQRGAYAADPSNAPAPLPLEPTQFSLIANIAQEHCFLRPDGYFKADAKFVRPFSETILTCALVAPPAEFAQLTADFKKALESFNKLVRGLGSPRSGSMYAQFNAPHIRARHRVFEPTTDEKCEEASNLPAEFTVSGWPTSSDAARDARDELVATHVARPLPAFDVNGDLVPPSRYLADLQGATVVVKFSLSHFPIRGKNMTVHTMCVNIEHMRVLIPPTRRPTNKRPLASLTDPLSNVAQKRKVE
ncbi:hypothetical protein GSI_10941 [Ganoderma sinense ZZ0214-1]|uniref:Uncharacterized protein n=1 Tax=Ganoderma sinense ZZ0214-1 TaxID=1077348 RepID=A0A2G8S2L6_9APHY|nr:hypothetical protein GSI_10941 [Ganoderma sinense ZZ0214-1]